jgi:hypothetical protein
MMIDNEIDLHRVCRPHDAIETGEKEGLCEHRFDGFLIDQDRTDLRREKSRELQKKSRSISDRDDTKSMDISTF